MEQKTKVVFDPSNLKKERVVIDENGQVIARDDEVNQYYANRKR